MTAPAVCVLAAMLLIGYVERDRLRVTDVLVGGLFLGALFYAVGTTVFY